LQSIEFCSQAKDLFVLNPQIITLNPQIVGMRLRLVVFQPRSGSRDLTRHIAGSS